MPPSVNPRFGYVLNVSSKLVGDGKCGKKTWQLYVLRFSCLFLATLARQSSGGKVCRSVDWPPWSHWNISTTIGQGVTVFKHKYNMSHSNLKWGLWVHNQDPQMFLTCLPVSPQLRKLWFLRYACFLFTVCVCVCGRVFVHGRMSLDGNKLQRVFQDSVSKACWLIMMMSIMLMRVLIDTKQMAGCSWGYTTSLWCIALPSAGTITAPGETVIKQKFV